VVDAVDGYCDRIGFTAAQLDRLFAAAARLSLPVKVHAEQLTDAGGALLAARHRALSADHLEHLSADGVRALAGAGTVAVLLPGAFLHLRDTRPPPVAALRAAGVSIAVATDCNPGTSPLTSLTTAMNLACTLFRLTPAEALAGVTRHAARALGLDDRGRLAVGLRADLALWDADHPAELAARISGASLATRIVAGRPHHAPTR
jgi:imidazolonepropionase